MCLTTHFQLHKRKENESIRERYKLRRNRRRERQDNEKLGQEKDMFQE
jgi:hypothetical protein